MLDLSKSIGVGYNIQMTSELDEYKPSVPYDIEDPRSVYNLVPQWTRNVMHLIPSDLWMLDEPELRKRCSPDARVNRIRLAFWAEYEAAQAKIGRISFYEVSRRCGIAEYFIRKLLEDTHTLAFVLCAPASYDSFLEEALQHSLSRLREVLDFSLHDENGRPNIKQAEMVLKTAAFLDMRKNGAFVNRTFNVHKIQNETVNAPAEQNKLTSEELDKKIRQLEQKKEYIQLRDEIGNISLPHVEIVPSE